MEIIILTVWAIWNTRNGFIFKNKRPSHFTARRFLKDELKWLKFRATRKAYSNFHHWIDSFV
jgi:hypothetical protein